MKIVLAAFAFSAAVLVLRTLIFQWLWNLVIVDMFAAPEVTFFSALALQIIGSLIFSQSTATLQKVKS